MAALVARGHSVDYYTLDQPPATVSNTGVNIHLFFFPLKQRSGVIFWGLFLLIAPLLLMRAAYLKRPDRILAFGAFYAALLRPARLLCGAPLIVFIRSLVFKINALNDRPKVAQLISNSIDRCGLNGANTVVCMSHCMAEEIRRKFGTNCEKIRIVSNDLPTPSSAGTHMNFGNAANNETLVVGCSGVLDVRKNVLLAIQACGNFSLHHNPQKILLVIAGSGPLLSRYRLYVEEKQIKNVIFLGWQDSLADLYASCQLVVHPSLHEGVSNSLLEAIADGLPILASNCPEHKELLANPALLFEPEATALTRKLQDILDTPQALIDLRSKTQQLRAQLSFDWEKAACSTIET
jgi:glycosyltransferase involved in cell wall biosynthesis